MKDIIHRSSGNIFLDLGFPGAEAETLLMRAELMEALRRLIVGHGWTQAETAEHLGIGPSQSLTINIERPLSAVEPLRL